MFREETKEVMRYFKKVACFVVPLAFIFLFPFYILFVSGELLTPDQIIDKQINSSRPTLVGLAYSNPEIYFKMHSVLRRSPKVVAVGNSRVLAFTADFFSSNSFFNAGRGVQKIEHFRSFLNTIPSGKEPRIILIGLDQVLFGGPVNSYERDDFKQKIERYDTPLDIYLDQWQNIWKEYLWKGKISIRKLAQHDNTLRIGSSALVSDNGFQSDGSYHYGNFLERQASSPDEQSRFVLALEQIKNHDQEHFPPVDHINEAAVEEFSLFLAEANRRGIHVISFLPPFAPTVYQSLLADSAHFPYIFKLSQTLQPIFKKYEFGLFDFSNAATIRSPDAEFMDGGHGLQKTYLRVLISIAEVDKKMQQFTDIKRLKFALQQSNSQFVVTFKD